MKKRSLALGVLLLVLAAMLALHFTWRQFLESRLREALAQRGVEAAFTLGGISLHQAELTNVRLGPVGSGWTLQGLTLAYTPRQLLDRQLQTLTLSGLSLHLALDGDAPLGPLTPLLGPSSGTAQLPVTAAAFETLPFERVTVTESTLRITQGDMEITLPFTLEFSRLPAPALHITVTQASAVNRATQLPVLHLTALTADAALDETRKTPWQGTWQATVSFPSKDKTPPKSAELGGTLAATARKATISGTMTTSFMKANAAFALALPFDNPKSGAITVSRASAVWQDNTVTLASPLRLPLAFPARVTTPLSIRNWSMQPLLDISGEKGATATGSVSGAVAVTFTPKGELKALSGDIRADGPGEISLPPHFRDRLPVQLSQVKDLLARFHYENLSLTLAYENARQSALLLLEGSNPDVYGGRLIRFKVNFGGDLLESLQQTLMPVNDPQQWLKDSK